jgi:Leucine-rich repeat (LRR) protein
MGCGSSSPVAAHPKAPATNANTAMVKSQSSRKLLVDAKAQDDAAAASAAAATAASNALKESQEAQSSSSSSIVDPVDIPENRISIASNVELLELNLCPVDSSKPPPAVLEFPKLLKAPLSLFRLTHLQKLSLKGNALATLPIELKNLTSLVEFDASENALTSVPPGLFEAWASTLVSLTLSENYIAMLPETIGSMSKLERLIVFKNDLTQLPSSIAKCSSLQELNVFNNKLTSLPSVLGTECSSIVDFNAGSNKLTMFLPDVTAWTSCKRIALQDNKITTLPDLIPCAPTLVQLQLANNSLMAFPVITGATNLKLLDVSSNTIEVIPDDVYELTSLEALNAKKNGIVDVPASICGLGSLTLLDLQMNSIEVLPNHFDNSIKTNLNSLLLGKNKIKYIPSTIKECTKLSRLLLDQCPLVIAPTADVEDVRFLAHKELLLDMKEQCEKLGGFLRCSGTPLGVRPKK